jgi:rSAM/selenodomain-associated transferase 1
VSRPLVVLFTKPSRPGRVKTRLVGDLTEAQAAELHAAFLSDLLAELAGGAFDLRVAWALDADEALPPTPVGALRQRGNDLGQRLWNALREAGVGRPAVAAIGSDTPRLDRARVERAFAALAEGHDVCLGPTADGGYYLLAVRRAALSPALFHDIDWSTAEVAAQTLAACARDGLRVATLPRERDVDTPQDLAALVATLAAEPGGCPRTRALLERWGRFAEVTA